MSKTRHGAKVAKRYDTATTPLNRLLDSFNDMIDPHDLDRLHTLHLDTDIENLKHKLTNIQANLLEHARRRGQVQHRAKTNHVYLSQHKMNNAKRAPSDESTNQSRRAS